MHSKISEYYQYFYRKVSGRSAFIFRPTKAEEVMIDKFVKVIGENAGENYLFRYMCFQFHRWHNLETRFGKGIIPIAWVIGSKAYDYHDLAKDTNWKLHSTILFEKFDVQKSDLISNIGMTNIIVDVSPSEESDRKLYLNTKRGLIFCLDYTSQWHPKSEVCRACSNRNECVELMEVKYPLILSKRKLL